MPKDASGKFHLNLQRAHAADRAAKEKPAEALAGSEAPIPEHAESENSVPGHLRALHAEMGGKHMHVHHDGESFTTHHVGEDGEVEGPHHHEDPEELKAHLDRFFTEEAAEPGESYEHETGKARDIYD